MSPRKDLHYRLKKTTVIATPTSSAGVKARICWKRVSGTPCLIGGLVLGVEVLSDGGDLTKLELSEAQAAPALRRTHKGAEHELEHRLLAEAVRD